MELRKMHLELAFYRSWRIRACRSECDSVVSCHTDCTVLQYMG